MTKVRGSPSKMRSWLPWGRLLSLTPSATRLSPRASQRSAGWAAGYLPTRGSSRKKTLKGQCSPWSTQPTEPLSPRATRKTLGLNHLSISTKPWRTTWCSCTINRPHSGREAAAQPPALVGEGHNGARPPLYSVKSFIACLMKDCSFSGSLLWNLISSSMLSDEKHLQYRDFNFCAGLEAHSVTGKEGSLIYTQADPCFRQTRDLSFGFPISST